MSENRAKIWHDMMRRSFHPLQWYDEGRGLGLTLDEEVIEEKIMWVYRNTEPGTWTVGYWSPDRQWFADSDHHSKQEATTRVHYLNGGN